MLLSWHWGAKQEMGFDMLAMVQTEYAQGWFGKVDSSQLRFMFIIVQQRSSKTLGNVISNKGFFILGFYV